MEISRKNPWIYRVAKKKKAFSPSDAFLPAKRRHWNFPKELLPQRKKPSRRFLLRSRYIYRRNPLRVKRSQYISSPRCRINRVWRNNKFSEFPNKNNNSKAGCRPHAKRSCAHNNEKGFGERPGGTSETICKNDDTVKSRTQRIFRLPPQCSPEAFGIVHCALRHKWRINTNTKIQFL